MKRPIRRNYDIAGAFIMLAGLLYLPLILIDGWNGKTKFFAVIGILWILLGLAMRGRRRWLAYLVYTLNLFATLIAFAFKGPGWWWWLIIAMHVLAIFFLFKLLWAPKSEFEK